jgi:hypothetical protein
MKKLLVFTVIMSISLLDNKATAEFVSDKIINQTSVYEKYLKKSHDQKKVSKIMLIGGSAMVVTGISMTLSSLKGLFDPNSPTPKDYGSAPDILAIGGGLVIAAAIPIAIAAGKNKKKARLYMNEENVMIKSQIIAGPRLTSIVIKIRL